MSEQDIAIMESIAESVAESVAESMMDSMDGAATQTASNNTTSSSDSNAGSDAQSGNTTPTQAGAQSGNTAPTQSGNSNAQTAPIGDGFAAEHGALRVDGTQLVDQNGDPIQLYGMSTHGIAWFPQFVSYDTFKTLRDDWNTNCVRLAMYTHENSGYCAGGDQDYLKSLVRSGVDAATDLGMYVIVDWHVLQDQDPNVYKDQALAFFKEMSETYADHTNVIYEICNEPNGYATWDSVKSYAEEVIPVIRENDPDAVIIVGTPTWSQDIDQAKANPLDEENILYALHFYAGTHKDVLWNRLDSCVQNGLPVFVSEFGMCDASGNGANDFNSAESWFDVIEKYNISFCCWNLANKDESSSVLKASCSKTCDWSEEDLNESGKWIREYFRSKQ
ncbi:MAG: glycoside hydrolase family 5 protein [Acetatifactor muris]|nr:glycoside hydrolase family 5 protein [Acetatifactor muris]MCM1525715.1 glycoside hydrolase family 5 protein [Bacteroides sp.]